MRMMDLDPDRRSQVARAGRASTRTRRSAGGTSATSRTTCGSWRRSTTTSGACSTTSTTVVSPSNTIVMYTSDQGFFLGDHGMFDKRLMYEESLTMPFLVRYPADGDGPARSTTTSSSTSTSHQRSSSSPASTIPERRPGPLDRAAAARRDARRLADSRCTTGTGCTTTARTRCPAHYGVRTKTHKLICYYNDPLGQTRCARTRRVPIEWELFDLVDDPLEVHNIYGDARRRIHHRRVARRADPPPSRRVRRAGAGHDAATGAEASGCAGSRLLPILRDSIDRHAVAISSSGTWSTGRWSAPHS